MAIPTSPTWNIADFNELTLGSLLSLGPADLTITPSVLPYFTYNGDYTVLTADSRDGVEATLDFNISMPSRFTVEITARFPFMPHNVGDLEHRRVGLTLADDAGRGISVYFSSNGVAVSRVDDFGSVSALPDTTDTTEEIRTDFRTIRVAVDGGLGRAYVFISNSETAGLALQYIIPVEASTIGDTFRVFTKGLATQPSSVEIKALRVAGDLIVPNFPPVADGGPDRVAPVGQAVRFDGRGSFDIEGAPLSYLWRVIDAPFGSAYAHENSSGATTDDGDADGFTTILSFTPGSLPAWVGPGDVLRIGDAVHVIDTVNNPGGSLTVTTDTIPDNLSSTPFRIIRQSILVGAETETPYLVGDVQGIYRVRLTVNDGEVSSEEAEVLANYVGARSPFGLEPDVRPIWQALGDEWQYIEGREVFEESWRGVAQILSGKLLEAWQHHYNFSIRDAQRVFQKKWIPYRTLLAETDPDAVVISERHGVLQATHDFEGGDPTVVGLTLVIEYFTGASPTDMDSVTVTLTGNTLAQILTDLNTALAGTGVEAYSFATRQETNAYRFDGASGTGAVNTLTFPPLSLPSWVDVGDTLILGDRRFTITFVNNPGGTLTVSTPIDPVYAGPFRIWRHVRLGLRSFDRAFRVTSASTAAAALGFTADTFNYLSGTNGALATDRTYFVGDGVSLLDHGVVRGDLLVLNNGQSLRIDRIVTSALDPLPGQRVLLFEALPLDATETWTIPSVVLSDEVDYEFEGTYPGDLVKAELYDSTDQSVTNVRGVVVAQKGKQLAVRLDGLFPGRMNTTRYELRVLGVKRRKGIPIDADILHIPQLQDLIPVAQSPTLWKENVDYVFEPFYRDVDSAPVPMLQFRDSVFVDPDLEPPDILWAELTVFSNEPNVENLFGRLVGFLRDDASLLPEDFNYTAGVAGLLYSQQRGPSVFAVGVGAQILFGQPFAEVAGVIEEIRTDYSPTQGRLLIRDQDGNTPTQSEIVRSYFYKKDPLDLSTTSGLDINPDTGLPWAEGDSIAQFQPIGAGVDIVDLYNTPRWYVPFVKGGLITEIEKFHYFLVTFNLDLVSLSNLVLLYQFVLKVKPTYSHPLLVGLRNHVDDIDPVDDLDMTLYMHLYDSTCGSGRAYMYDDYRGDGTIWSSFDDGATFFDALVDCPTDIIEFCLQITWADSPAVLTGGIDLTLAAYPADFAGNTLELIIDGVSYPVVFGAVANAAAVVTAIDAFVGSAVASLDATNGLVITSPNTGTQDFLGVGDGTSAGGAILTFTPGTLPVWVTAGDLVHFEGFVGHISTVNNGLGTMTVTPPLLPAAAGQDFRVWEPLGSVVIGPATTLSLLSVIGTYVGQDAYSNAILADGPWFVDLSITDILGSVGSAGSTFSPVYDMSLPAGTYRVCFYPKNGHIVLPPPPPPP